MGVYGWQYGQGPGNGWWIVGVVVMVLFWSVVVLGVAFALRHWRSHAYYGHGHHHDGYAHPAGPGPYDGGPVEVLRMRFAKGEIDEAEFTSRLAKLEQRP